MKDFIARSETVKKDQGQLRSTFDKLSAEIEQARSMFFNIERKCFSNDNDNCISQHDRYKLEIAQVQRLGDREKMMSYEKCTPIIPQDMMPSHVDNWQINNQQEAAIFSNYFHCFKPYMSRYMGYMRQEREVFERANKSMSEALNHN